MFFGNLLNNYFYGKAGKGDFTLENLPQNRRQLFADVLKVRWSSLVGVNLLYILFWLPAIAWTFINVVTLISMMGAEEAVYTAQDISGLLMNYLLILAPCIAITGPFKAGITYVLRNWARDEHSFVLSDFKDAVKANWKQGLAVSIINGVLPFLVYVCWYFYGSLLQDSFIFILPISLVFLVAIMWSLSQMVMYVMMITYDLKLRNIIRNAMLLTLAKLPFAVLIKLATLALPVIGFLLAWFIPSIQGYVLLIVSLLYLVFMTAFNNLITASYSNWLCETYLNPKIEGARTGIGLRPENWDDVEYIPEDDQDD